MFQKISLSRTSLIFLTAVIASCGFDIQRIHPHFLDTKRGYARIYKAIPATPKACGDPEYEFVDSGERKPISEMSGYVALPTDEVQYILNRYNEARRKELNCGE